MFHAGRAEARAGTDFADPRAPAISLSEGTGIYLELDFADDSPAVNSLLTTDIGFVVSPYRVTIDLARLFISVDQACELLTSLPCRPARVDIGTHVLAYREFNPDDHAGALLRCDDMFRVKQPAQEYAAENVPVCPFYVPRTKAVHIGNAPKAPIGTAQNCFLLSSAALGMFEEHAAGVAVPLYVNGALRKSHSAWFPGKTQSVLEPLFKLNQNVTCLTCQTQYLTSPADRSCYGGTARIPAFAIDEIGFGHHGRQHEAFVSIEYLAEFHQRFRSMIGLQPVYRPAHKWVMSARQILSVVCGDIQ